jgi:hypothetical protein
MNRYAAWDEATISCPECFTPKVSENMEVMSPEWARLNKMKPKSVLKKSAKVGLGFFT